MVTHHGSRGVYDFTRSISIDQWFCIGNKKLGRKREDGEVLSAAQHAMSMPCCREAVQENTKAGSQSVCVDLKQQGHENCRMEEGNSNSLLTLKTLCVNDEMPDA